MKLIYIAGPLTHPDPVVMETRRHQALAVGRVVEAAGPFVAFVPHAHILEPKGGTAEAIWKAAMRKCIAHLRRADYILPLAEWEKSRGARMEVWLCRRRSGFPRLVANLGELEALHVHR